MATLNLELRSQLKKVVAEARRIGVKGAENVLTDEYAVGKPEPWPTMDAGQRELRKELRAHGRQLGDQRDERTGRQETAHLVQACAYEHWHRMLFARFLAENNLLLDAEHGLPLPLEDVRELAREQGRDWMELASELAQRMLLRVFDGRDPVLCVTLPTETRLQLEDKLGSLPSGTFLADDSLGWVYQFWQKDEKDRVNDSGVKIGGDELPAVTQLFTEDYMVLFLLENTLGAWWTAKRLSAGLDPKLPGYEWTYLRLKEDGTPAAGGFEGWPKTARELKVLDPCMGSGHFLTFALPILAGMRQQEEGLSLPEAIAAVLRDNLFGLELDARCAQIAAFNLALTAWRLGGAHFELPALNLACSGLGIHAPESDWIALAGEDGRAREEMRRLYSLFKDAPTLGSLIDPLRLQENVVAAGADRVLPLLEEALTREQGDEEKKELVIAAQGVLAAFRLLAGKYTLVVTNVPYLGRGKQDWELAKYCAEFHSDAKADLATCFVDRCLSFCERGGSAAIVTPQNWLFLTRYRELRLRLLETRQWTLVVKLGPNAFQDMNWWAATTALIVLTQSRAEPIHVITSWDVSDVKPQDEKMTGLQCRVSRFATQVSQVQNPDHRITMGTQGEVSLLSTYAGSYVGIQNGDTERFVAYIWEVPSFGESWSPFLLPCESNTPYGGRTGILFWQQGSGVLSKSEGLQLKGREAWNKWGVAVRQTRHLPATLYSGEFYDQSSAAIIPFDPSHLPAIWAFCSSKEFHDQIRQVDSKVQVTNSTMVKVPFDLAYWQTVASEKYPNGLPQPHSSDPTQWLFNGHPRGSNYPLQVAVARLLSYRWPQQNGCSFADSPALGSDGLEKYVGSDGIVCLSHLAGESGAEECLRSLLAAAYQDGWSASTLFQLLNGSTSLHTWLQNSFFKEHCELFQSRPFIWHIWDGQRDGFHAFVNYHRISAPNGEGKKTLERLTYTILNEWIERQRSEVVRNVDGAEVRLAAAIHLQSELKKILEGEPPYDIFVRWKSLHEQPIGWEPDINDGVRINIRPFLMAKPYKPSRRDSCILRVTPKISYSKDRGREPWREKEDYPWFWNWDERTEDFKGGETFDGARWNDLHYSISAKQKARARRK